MQKFNASDMRVDMAEVGKKGYYSFKKVRTDRDYNQLRFNCEIQIQIKRDFDGI